MDVANREEAKQAVRAITDQYGILADDDMDTIGNWNPEIRRRIEKNWLALETVAAHSIKTLAKQIYGSGARFVFELLQNADDNSFTRIDKSKEVPFVSFQVHPNRIIVECNEDGFTKDNVEAICKVGQSTKSAKQGYIGAKGIGFKSVFIAASKVSIQSGHFSFYFKHAKGDSGIGMVRPVWYDPTETLNGPLTRMTLELHNEGDPRQVEHLNNVIFQQLQDLQETCLMFLKNLKCIRVAFYGEKGNLKDSKEFRTRHDTHHTVALDTTICKGGEETVETKHYHVTRQMVHGLAISENRDLPDNKEAQKSWSSAEVVLAFPITDASEPLVTSKQNIFAFLPVKEAHFRRQLISFLKFLIQSDFDTDASREGIVTTSRRNIGLLDGIAATFATAAQQFCEHPKLRYSWPSFLPDLEDVSDPFWSRLCQKLKDMILGTPLFEARHTKTLHVVSKLMRLSRDASDEKGQPLFDDTVLNPYISDHYSFRSLQKLKDYGLQNPKSSVYLELMKADLCSTRSRMKAATSSQKWHSAVVSPLNHWLEQSSALKRGLKQLAVLPLSTDEWISAQNGPFYLPTTGGVPVPDGLNLRILSSSAVSNPDRKRFFVLLGASEPLRSQVKSAIFEAYNSGRNLTISQSVAILRYLYVTHTLGEFLDPRITVICQDEHVANPRREDVYIHDQDPLGPAELLKGADTFPSFPISFLHDNYLFFPPATPASQLLSWRDWLCEVLGVRTRLRLISREGDSLSQAFTYVAKNQPLKVLDLLEHLWKDEGSSVHRSTELKRQVNQLRVEKLCGLERALTLEEAWLPSPALRRQVDRYMENPDAFPFLDLQRAETPEEFALRWSFLYTYLGVKHEDDITFLMEIVRQISHTHDIDQHAQVRKVCDLYIAIESACRASDNANAWKQKISTFFKSDEQRTIFRPAFGGKDATWVTGSSCLWRGLPSMWFSSSLKDAYETITNEEDFQILSSFFTRTIALRDSNWKDIVLDLRETQRQAWENFDEAKRCYKYLHHLEIEAEREELSITDKIRRFFEENSLILATKDGVNRYYKTSECLWSSTTEIRGKVTLNEEYEELEKFFIETIGVKLLTIDMMYDDLLQAPRASEREAKDALMSFTALLLTEADRALHLDRAALCKANIFPVRYADGGVAMRSSETPFIIGDREHLKAQFQSEFKFLDYDLEEIQSLKPFFEWAKLGDRYLSNLVKEVTSVSPGRTRPISETHHDLKRKAHAILRISATFNSPRFEASPDELYGLLQTIEVLETDGITCTRLISYDGKRAEVPGTAGREHIGEDASSLKVYVPRKRRERALCFASTLPQKLLDWLMTDPTTNYEEPVSSDALSIMKSIITLGTVDRSALEDALEHQGIIQVSIPNEDIEYESDDESEDDESVSDTNAPVDGTAHLAGTPTPLSSNEYIYTPSTPTPLRSPTMDEEDVVSVQSVTARNESRGTYRGPRPTSVHLNTEPAPQPGPAPSPENAQYRALLARVVAAGRVANLPRAGVFGMSSLLGALPDASGGGDIDAYDGPGVMSRFRSTSQLERDKMIGAAGELYVFELLTRLGLDGWSQANWKSTIRHYVTIHPDYTTLGAWLGSETADFVYDDTSGDFTSELIESGHLDDSWEEARPKYFVEVKTTTGPCEWPFYMSRKQYNLMRTKHNSTGRSEVYMILRVFWVNDDRISLRVYVDPEQLRQDARLVFTGHVWSITPSESTRSLAG